MYIFFSKIHFLCLTEFLIYWVIAITNIIYKLSYFFHSYLARVYWHIFVQLHCLFDWVLIIQTLIRKLNWTNTLMAFFVLCLNIALLIAFLLNWLKFSPYFLSHFSTQYLSSSLLPSLVSLLLLYLSVFLTSNFSIFPHHSVSQPLLFQYKILIVA